MSSRITRELTAAEATALAQRLAEFRKRYHEWSGMTDWELIEFARYEGVAGKYANKVEPIVIGAG